MAITSTITHEEIQPGRRTKIIINFIIMTSVVPSFFSFIRKIDASENFIYFLSQKKNILRRMYMRLPMAVR